MASQRKNRPTLRDVAHEAGVGTTTVSRVINGGHYVAPKMLARIQRVMLELGYQPNQAARSLKSEQSRTIGVIVPSITDPFFARFAEVAEAHARGKGYAIILLTSRDTAELELDDLRIFQRHRVDGLLIVPPRTSPKVLLKNVRRLGIPTVAFDRPIAKSEFSTVLSDNYKGAQDAVRHLINHRRKRILCIGGDQKLHTIQERLRGASDALAAAGCETLLEPHASDYASAEASIAKHLTPKRSIDAIFGLHNHATVMAYEVLQNHKIRIPDAISLIGFDDFALAATLRPSITVVQQSIEELALTAIRLLFSRMAGEVSTPQQIEIACNLVLRQSCGCEKTR
jgi:LacI family transcriptional regulator